MRTAIAIVEPPIELHSRGWRVTVVQVINLAKRNINIYRRRHFSVCIRKGDQQFTQGTIGIKISDDLTILDQTSADKRYPFTVDETKMIVRIFAAISIQGQSCTIKVTVSPVKLGKFRIVDAYIIVQHYRCTAFNESGIAIESKRTERRIQVTILVQPGD